MAHKIRRVITGHDKNGKAICISDSFATEILQRDSRPGVTLTNFWKSKTTPTEYDGEEETLGGPFILHPPKNGSIFRMVEFEPEDPEVLENLDGKEAFSAMGASHAIVENSRHPFMHRTDSVDYAIIVKGEITMLLDDSEVRCHLSSEHNIKLLWEVCRIPDFEKIFNNNYLNFLKNIFLKLVNNNLKIPEDWISNKVLKLENYNGDIPELSLKISQIRTWTYISNHQSWLTDPKYWQEKTQKIENDLSDNLHEGLTNKFIDVSSKFFIDTHSDYNIKKVELDSDQTINLDGENYGKIKGFELEFNKNSNSHSLFSLSHVKKSIRNMIEDKIEDFLNAPEDSLNFGNLSEKKINEKIYIYWGDDKVGQLTKGSKIYLPIAESFNSEFITTEKKLLISAKLQNWIDNQISDILNPIKNKLDDNINSNVRAIAFNCFENLGILEIEEYKDFIKNIDTQSKQQLFKLGIRIGAKFFFIPNFMKKKPIELNAILWTLYNNYDSEYILPLPTDGRVSFTSNVEMPKSYWNSIGYINLNNFIFRVDVFEKVFYLARKKMKYGPCLESSDLMNPIGCNSNQLKDIMSFCGYEYITISDDKKLFFLSNKKKETKKNKINKLNKKINIKDDKDKIERDPNSPFAVLEKLL